MKKKILILMVISIFALSLLFSESGYVEYSGTGATANTAILNVSLTSNGDTLSVGFSSSNPKSEEGKITPVTVFNLSSVLGFDSSGHRTVIGNATLYPYWQIQMLNKFKVSLYRKTAYLSSRNGNLTYSASLPDDQEIPVSDDGTNSATVYEYQGGNAFVVGSTEITIETEDVISAKQDENMINFPYGTTFTGYIYIKVSSAT